MDPWIYRPLNQWTLGMSGFYHCQGIISFVRIYEVQKSIVGSSFTLGRNSSERQNSQLDYTKRKSSQPPVKTVSGGQGTSNALMCMFTNIDTFTNKKYEYETRMNILNPDIIRVTKINPKNASWSIIQQDLRIEGYNLYVNSMERGSALCIG